MSMNPMEAEQNRANAQSPKAPCDMRGWDAKKCRCGNNEDYCDHCMEVEQDAMNYDPSDRY